MGKSIKKKRIRWDRIFILVFAVFSILISGTLLVKNIFTKPEQISQPISLTQNAETAVKYNTPTKGEDGVYRIENTIIVNKKYGLLRGYNPGENQEAKNQLELMLKKMIQEKFKVALNYSGYRSYEAQEVLYNQYVASNGQVKADTFSARPGFSEHQTGLAFDIIDQTGELLQSKTNPQAVEWLAQHAYEYGFIVRYLEDKESITGYTHEEWHVRYLGKELAKRVYESKLSLEEYYNIEGGSYN